MNLLANVLASNREALAALDEAAGVYRRLGNRAALHGLLAGSALVWLMIGDAEHGKQWLEEARSEAELIGDAPDYTYFYAKAGLLLNEADLAGARAAIRAYRGATSADAPSPLEMEAWVPVQQDHLEEARVSYRRAAQLAGNGGEWILGFACRVECEQGHPAEGLACLAPLRFTFGGYAVRDLHEAHCKYLLKDFSGAEKAARRALADAQLAEDFIARILGSVELARAMAARGQTAKAISGLRATLAEVESKQLLCKPWPSRRRSRWGRRSFG